MSSEYAVELKGVSKIYKLKSKENPKAKSYFYALKNITFRVEKGDVVGILGTNGSGKSTLSSILSEISCPDEGKIRVNGEQALVAINTGLNNQLTGFENIQFKGALLGLSKKRIEEITNGVVEFAELGDFLYQPVKNYSSGMKSRLGFSISICLNPDIIIVDEALSVGDKAFADKCLKKFEEFKQQGKTIFFISHSLPQVKSFCTKGLWIEGGELRKYGAIDEVASEYSAYVEKLNKLNIAQKKEYSNEVFKRRVFKKEVKDIKFFLKSRMKKKYKRLYVGLIIVFALILSVSFGSYCLHATTNDTSSSTAIFSQDAYNITFLLEGPDVKIYKDSYREYLDEYKGETILDIVNLEINSNGEVELTRVPAHLQVYYEQHDIYDEIRFMNLIQSDEQVYEQLSQVIKSDIDNIYVISYKTLKLFSEEIGLELKVDEDKYEWTIKDEKMLIDYDSYNKETNETYLKLFKHILSKIQNHNNMQKEQIIHLLTLDSMIDSGELFSNIYEFCKNKPLTLSMNTLDMESTSISKLIDNTYDNEFIEPIILNKKLLFLDEKTINKNVYLSFLIDEVENQLTEYNDVQSSHDQLYYKNEMNDIDSGSNSGSSSGSNSGSSSGSNSGSSSGSNSGSSSGSNSGSSSGSNSGSSSGSNSGSSSGSNSGSSLGSNSGSSSGSNSGSSSGSNSGSSSGNNSGSSSGSNSGSSSGSNSGNSSGNNSGSSSGNNNESGSGSNSGSSSGSDNESDSGSNSGSSSGNNSGSSSGNNNESGSGSNNGSSSGSDNESDLGNSIENGSQIDSESSSGINFQDSIEIDSIDGVEEESQNK